ncbi:MAG: hypothetical protein ACREHC_06390 [Candidatus Levyibacteriota bacterium]
MPRIESLSLFFKNKWAGSSGSLSDSSEGLRQQIDESPLEGVDTDTLLQTPAQVDNIFIPEIKELLPPLDSIVDQMKGSFQNGDYGALVGDDTSGRIPTLILRGVVNHINTAHERPAVPTIFVQGRDILSTADTERLTQQMQLLTDASEGQRALIVSEFLATGGHVKGIGRVIHSAGIPYDIATIGKAVFTKNYQRYGTLSKDEQIFSSPGVSQCPAIYGKRELTGLARHGERVYVDPTLSRNTVLTARRDVQTAIGQLVARHKL